MGFRTQRVVRKLLSHRTCTQRLRFQVSQRRHCCAYDRDEGKHQEGRLRNREPMLVGNGLQQVRREEREGRSRSAVRI